MLTNLALLTTYIQPLGFWAPTAAFVLFMLQAALPVFPYLVLAAGSGMLFGFKTGVWLAWSGSIAGACLNYWFCRLIGYETVSLWLYKRYGYNTQNQNNTTAFWSIVISMIVPFLPMPLVNAAAALGGVPFRNFILAVALGKIPIAVLYTGLGLALFNARDANTILLIIAAVIILLLGLKMLGDISLKA